MVAYGQILSKEILDIPRCACINGHASLLPKYRGASPIQSAILNGDEITGTTSMLMDVGLDTGDILLQKSLMIDKKETSDTLFEKLSHLTADIILETIKNESCIDVDRKIRAYTSWPSAFIDVDGTQYKIWDVDICGTEIDLSEANRFSDDIYIYKDRLFAKCKDGIIEINEIQKSGKNRMKAKDFINGLK